MPLIEGVLYCDGCGAEILGAPHVWKEQNFCCMDCFNGVECNCGVFRDDDAGLGNLPPGDWPGMATRPPHIAWDCT